MNHDELDRLEKIADRLEVLIPCASKLAQELNALTGTQMRINFVHQKILTEASCLLTEKTIHQALEQLDRRKKPLNHRQVPKELFY